MARKSPKTAPKRKAKGSPKRSKTTTKTTPVTEGVLYTFRRPTRQELEYADRGVASASDEWKDSVSRWAD